jgi:hypothetical protein
MQQFLLQLSQAAHNQQAKWHDGCGHKLGSRPWPANLFYTYANFAMGELRSLTVLNEADIRAADKVVKESVGIELSCVCKIFYAVMKTAMDANEIDILVGKAGPCAAKCMLLYELDDLIENYLNGWQTTGLVVPVL